MKRCKRKGITGRITRGAESYFQAAEEHRIVGCVIPGNERNRYEFVPEFIPKPRGEQEMALAYVTDGEPNVHELVAFGLRDAGYEGAKLADGASLLVAVRQRRLNTVILGWMMPLLDGLAAYHILRKSPKGGHLPILTLTAKGEEFDRILELEIGADNCIVKPFNMKKLTARIYAMLHCSKRTARGVEKEVLTGGGLTVNTICHTATENSGLRELMVKESDLLVILIKHQGQAMMCDALLNKVWGVEYYGDIRTVDVRVRYLRQRVEGDLRSPRLVQTVCGTGYKLTEQERPFCPNRNAR